MTLVNEHMAHDSVGRFHVRFADNAPWDAPTPTSWEEIAHRQLDDLVWMGIEIDSTSYQSKQEEKVKLFLADFNLCMVMKASDHDRSRPIIPAHQLLGRTRLGAQHTAEKVVLDHWEGSDALIRGLEWVAEHHLYVYFCAVFGFHPPPLCYYIPRLLTVDDVSGSLRSKDISKTIGNWKMENLREAGATPEEVRRVLRKACLLDPIGKWSLDNLKDQPRLTIRSIEDVLGQR